MLLLQDKEEKHVFFVKYLVSRVNILKMTTLEALIVNKAAIWSSSTINFTTFIYTLNSETVHATLFGRTKIGTHVIT